MCNSIDLYGFESYRRPTSGKAAPQYHYFDNEAGITSVHSFVLIMKVFEFLSHRYPILIRTPHYDPEKERLQEEKERKTGSGKDRERGSVKRKYQELSREIVSRFRREEQAAVTVRQDNAATRARSSRDGLDKHQGRKEGPNGRHNSSPAGGGREKLPGPVVAGPWPPPAAREDPIVY
jgi:hypothetical protein